MFKQLVIVFSLIAFLGVLSFAQEKSKMDKKENQETMHKMQEMKKDQKESSVEENSKTWNKVCPVSGEDLDDDAVTIEYKGKTVGLCCSKCEKKFTKDPEKFMKNLSEDGSKFIGD